MKISHHYALTSLLASCAAALSSSARRIVVVSGGNRGVGIGICRQVLARDPEAEVLVTARKLDQAEAARDELNESLDTRRARARQLDVTDEQSCRSLAECLSDRGDGPLTLVNNAGVAYDLPWFPSPWPVEAASDTLDVNLLGAERLTRALLPWLLKSSDGRVINVSSGGGRANMSRMSRENREKLLDEGVSWEDILAMAEIFRKEYERAASAAIEDPESPQLPFLSPSGFWLQSYGFSKACLGSYTQILARRHPRLLSVACSPGFIATDMSKSYPQYDTLKTIDEGGEYVAELATGDRDALESGVFYQPEVGAVSFVAD